MQELVLDLHLHSRYSRAVSPRMNLQTMYLWGRKKGINILSVTDFTHPLWFRETKQALEEVSDGIYRLKDEEKVKAANPDFFKGEFLGPYFMLATEISAIYTENGKGHRIHNLVFAPNFDAAEGINKALAARGFNLTYDGRPTLGNFSTKDLMDLLLEVDQKTALIPCHCLLPDSLIHTKKGMKKIQDIQVGELVYTHKNRARKVIERLSRDYEGDIYAVRPWYFSIGLTTTSEHPFYALRVRKCETKGGRCIPTISHKKICTKKYYDSYLPEWIKAENLTTEDVLIYPRFKNTTPLLTVPLATINQYKNVNGSFYTGGTRGRIFPEKISISKEFCRLIGYYLAEGYTNGRDEIGFTFHQKEMEYVDDVIYLMNQVFGFTHRRIYQREKGNGIEISFYSKLLVEFFITTFYVHPPFCATTKTIPDWILHLPEDLQAELLRGWWRGDAGYTSSVDLMNAMKVICLRLGIISSITVLTKEKHSKTTHLIGTRRITATGDLYSLSGLAFFEDTYHLLSDPVFKKAIRKLTRRHGWVDKDYIYLPIRKIDKSSYKGKVFNLEVEEDNSYVTEFAAVHNCWTPWFSLYGSRSGYDHLTECFGKHSGRIFAIETGLSSDPAMNWRIKELTTRSIVSFSDAHSLEKMGREATVIKLKDQNKKAIELADITYSNILNSFVRGKERVFEIGYTIEFYPEEGKYHYTGHRTCGISFSPKDDKEKGTICPVCRRELTVGVMHRVDELATSPEENFIFEKDENGVMWVKDPTGIRPPFVSLVPFLEVLSEALGSGLTSQKVVSQFDYLVSEFGSEHEILFRAPLDKIRQLAGDKIAEGISKVRSRNIAIIPGFDGEYGKVKIWKDETAGTNEPSPSEPQPGLEF